MKNLVIRTLIRMILLLVCVSIIVFILVSVSPINPLQANIGQTALGSMSEEQIERLEEYWGVDVPPMERFISWAKDFFSGDWGTSLLYRRSVQSVIAEKFLNSALMLMSAWLISGVLGFALGCIAGANQEKAIDKMIKGYSLFITSAPVFWIALILLMIFSVWLKILPIGFSVPIGIESSSVTLFDRLEHALLPALTLSITGISNIALHTREKMIDVMNSDYVLFARARGESRWSIILRHGVRNTALPALTLQFASISEIFGGSILVEQVFSYPGIGQAAVTAGLGGDVPLLLGITVCMTAVVFTGNFTANLLYGAIDPRMRKGRVRS